MPMILRSVEVVVESSIFDRLIFAEPLLLVFDELLVIHRRVHRGLAWRDDRCRLSLRLPTLLFCDTLLLSRQRLATSAFLLAALPFRWLRP